MICGFNHRDFPYGLSRLPRVVPRTAIEDEFSSDPARCMATSLLCPADFAIETRQAIVSRCGSARRPAHHIVPCRAIRVRSGLVMVAMGSAAARHSGSGFFDPLLCGTPAIVELRHPLSRTRQVGHNEPTSGNSSPGCHSTLPTTPVARPLVDRQAPGTSGRRLRAPARRRDPCRSWLRRWRAAALRSTSAPRRRHGARSVLRYSRPRRT